MSARCRTGAGARRWPLTREGRYDRLDGLYPQFGNKSWAQKSLDEHAGDDREHTYSDEQVGRGASSAAWAAAAV